jgi:hypothetical protein
MIDDRKEIAKIYLKTWFTIDFISIVPFDFLMELLASESSANNNVNGIMRMTKVGKLYKLVKITRLIRMIKVMKSKKKIVKKMGSVMQTGAAFERLMYFLLLLFLIVHFIGCLWIM